MIRKTTGILVSGLALAFLSACRTAPIANVTEAAIPDAVDGALSLEQVTKGIVAAGAKHGWEMKVESPGLVVATLHLRRHTASVDISYTTKSYTILYKTSDNLKYDPDKKTIHTNYNSWVRNLHVAIQRQFGGAGQTN